MRSNISNIEEIDKSIDRGLAKSRAGAAWVVYSTVPNREQAAAFYERENAVKLHEKLTESEEPILMDVSEINCVIDEFKRLIRFDAQLYTVVLENGKVVLEDTFDSEVFNLRKPSFEPGHPEIFAGTYWGFSIHQAIENAQRQWGEQLKSQ